MEAHQGHHGQRLQNGRQPSTPRRPASMLPEHNWSPLLTMSSIATDSPSSTTSSGHTTASNCSTPSLGSPLINYPKKGLYNKKGRGTTKSTARRCRVIRDNTQGITKPAIRRLARRGKIKWNNSQHHKYTKYDRQGCLSLIHQFLEVTDFMGLLSEDSTFFCACSIIYHIILYHLISSHIISHHIISYHIISAMVYASTPHRLTYGGSRHR